MVRFLMSAMLVMVGAVCANAQEPARSASPKAVMSSSAPLNLNTATAAQLDALPGVGKATAERIVEYRQKNGGFKKPEDLMNVKGIGEKSFLKLKPLVTVSAPTARATQQ